MRLERRVAGELHRTGDVPAPADIVNRIVSGHAAEVMTELPAGAIDLIVTSPPYWTAVE